MKQKLLPRQLKLWEAKHIGALAEMKRPSFWIAFCSRMT